MTHVQTAGRKKSITVQPFWASWPGVLSSPPSLSSSFAPKWKANSLGHAEVEQWVSVVANELLFVRSLNLKENSYKIYTSHCILPLEKRFLIAGHGNELEKGMDRLQGLLSCVKHAFCTGHQRCDMCNTWEQWFHWTFCRVTELQGKQQPTTAGAKKRESNQLLASRGQCCG